MAAQPVTAASPSNGTLFAVQNFSSVVAVDPASGTTTPLAQVAGLGPNANIMALAADPQAARLYALMATCTSCPNAKGGGGPVFWQLVTINSLTGATQASPDLQLTLDASIAVDPATHDLWAITTCNECVSQEIVRAVPATGAETVVATLPGGLFNIAAIALAPQSGLLYIATLTAPSGSFELFALNTSTGVLSGGPSLGPSVSDLVFDAGSNSLFGVINTQQLVRIDPATGSETAVATFAGTLSTPTIDSATHTIYAGGSGIFLGQPNEIVSINDQTGATVIGGPLAGIFGSLAFQPLPITPDSVKADVSAALSSGAINNAGVGNALLAQLNAAAAAGASGQCGAAANIYSAFIHDLTAQSGKHVAAATAAQLESEAQFLIANCP